MPKPKDLSVNEKEFVQRLLHEAGTRYDGREFDGSAKSTCSLVLASAMSRSRSAARGS